MSQRDHLPQSDQALAPGDPETKGTSLKKGTLGLFGYSYMNDIKEQKGRKERKVFERGDRTKGKVVKELHAKARIEAGDADFKKFLVAKERSHGHH